MKPENSQWEKYKHLQDVDVETSEKILQRLMQIHHKKVGNRHAGIWDLTLELLARVLKHREQQSTDKTAKMLDVVVCYLIASKFLISTCVGVRMIAKMMIEKKTVSFRDIVEYEYAVLDILNW